MKINSNILNLHESYLFEEINQIARDYQAAHPQKRLIRLSIGDVTLPLPPVVWRAMEEACREQGDRETFRGYAPDQTSYGYDFLLREIVGYAKRNYPAATYSEDEIFISDGAKSDLGNLLDLFSKDNLVLLPNPVYPAYADANVIGGRNIIFLPASKENGFLPTPDAGVKGDLIYLCSPGNPTGAVYTKEGLKAWVDFARARGAVILFDAAYEAFVRDQNLPRSIFEIEGARECAIEICSLSKTAGFTGVRCGYTIVPKELKRDGVALFKLFKRRQAVKFNGVSYITQRGAAAALSKEGELALEENRAYYRQNADIITKTLKQLGFWYTGGENSPYIWLQCPKGQSSFGFFQELLERANVVTTPGSGFGSGGEGYLRLTSFGSHEDTEEACLRLAKLYGT